MVSAFRRGLRRLFGVKKRRRLAPYGSIARPVLFTEKADKALPSVLEIEKKSSVRKNSSVPRKNSVASKKKVVAKKKAVKKKSISKKKTVKKKAKN